MARDQRTDFNNAQTPDPLGRAESFAGALRSASFRMRAIADAVETFFGIAVRARLDRAVEDLTENAEEAIYHFRLVISDLDETNQDLRVRVIRETDRRKRARGLADAVLSELMARRTRSPELLDRVDQLRHELESFDDLVREEPF